MTEENKTLTFNGVQVLIDPKTIDQTLLDPDYDFNPLSLVDKIQKCLANGKPIKFIQPELAALYTNVKTSTITNLVKTGWLPFGVTPSDENRIKFTTDSNGNVNSFDVVRWLFSQRVKQGGFKTSSKTSYMIGCPNEKTLILEQFCRDNGITFKNMKQYLKEKQAKRREGMDAASTQPVVSLS